MSWISDLLRGEDRLRPRSGYTGTQPRPADALRPTASGVIGALETLIAEKQQVLNMLTRVCQDSDRLLDCLNEFAPEYPQACSDYCQELDTALAAVEAAGYCQRRGSP